MRCAYFPRAFIAKTACAAESFDPFQMNSKAICLGDESLSELPVHRGITAQAGSMRCKDVGAGFRLAVLFDYIEKRFFHDGLKLAAFLFRQLPNTRQRLLGHLSGKLSSCEGH